MKQEFITMAHGSGGLDSAELMRGVFAKHFDGEVLSRMEDSAIITFPAGAFSSPDGGGKIAVSTDTFVVSPLVFPGGDIGKLAVCGTVNDVLMSGAIPRYLACGFVLEVGLSIELLDGICASMARAAEESGTAIIAGDTKVVEGRASAGGLFINTTGIGVFERGAAGRPFAPAAAGMRPGDAVIVSGNLGDHHACILSARMGIANHIQSDCALLSPIVNALKDGGIDVHTMRDITRGGLGTVLNELAVSSGVRIELDEHALPVSPEVNAFCGIMGLDPMYMGNEGKLVFSAPFDQVDEALRLVRGTDIGRQAQAVGRVFPADLGVSSLRAPAVVKHTAIGGTVRVDVLYGEGLPRIC
ncbi:MAG: hydrogenase expression/formation protein HypE [Clostridiales Family XIII bacterium]|jgi:hydrogenase expression/formation protein HypE|nr:hydrogenase expression/formation protein HypE [Clostridiales Family XIII bacterium]